MGWLKILNESGSEISGGLSGTTNIKLSASANTSLNKTRNAVVRFTSGKTTRVVKVRQGSKAISDTSVSITGPSAITYKQDTTYTVSMVVKGIAGLTYLVDVLNSSGASIVGGTVTVTNRTGSAIDGSVACKIKHVYGSGLNGVTIKASIFSGTTEITNSTLSVTLTGRQSLTVDWGGTFNFDNVNPVDIPIKVLSSNGTCTISMVDGGQYWMTPSSNNCEAGETVLISAERRSSGSSPRYGKIRIYDNDTNVTSDQFSQRDVDILLGDSTTAVKEYTLPTSLSPGTSRGMNVFTYNPWEILYINYKDDTGSMKQLPKGEWGNWVTTVGSLPVPATSGESGGEIAIWNKNSASSTTQVSELYMKFALLSPYEDKTATLTARCDTVKTVTYVDEWLSNKTYVAEWDDEGKRFRYTFTPDATKDWGTVPYTIGVRANSNFKVSSTGHTSVSTEGLAYRYAGGMTANVDIIPLSDNETTSSRYVELFVLSTGKSTAQKYYDWQFSGTTPSVTQKGRYEGDFAVNPGESENAWDDTTDRFTVYANVPYTVSYNNETWVEKLTRDNASGEEIPSGTAMSSGTTTLYFTVTKNNGVRPVGADKRSISAVFKYTPSTGGSEVTVLHTLNQRYPDANDFNAYFFHGTTQSDEVVLPSYRAATKEFAFSSEAYSDSIVKIVVPDWITLKHLIPTAHANFYYNNTLDGEMEIAANNGVTETDARSADINLELYTNGTNPQAIGLSKTLRVWQPGSKLTNFVAYGSKTASSDPLAVRAEKNVPDVYPDGVAWVTPPMIQSYFKCTSGNTQGITEVSPYYSYRFYVLDSTDPTIQVDLLTVGFRGDDTNYVDYSSREFISLELNTGEYIDSNYIGEKTVAISTQSGTRISEMIDQAGGRTIYAELKVWYERTTDNSVGVVSGTAGDIPSGFSGTLTMTSEVEVE